MGAVPPDGLYHDADDYWDRDYVPSGAWARQAATAAPKETKPDDGIEDLYQKLGKDEEKTLAFLVEVIHEFLSGEYVENIAQVDDDSKLLYDLTPLAVGYQKSVAFRSLVVQAAKDLTADCAASYVNFAKNLHWLVCNLTEHWEDPNAWALKRYTLDEMDLAEIAQLIVEYDQTPDPEITLAETVMVDQFMEIMLTDYSELPKDPVTKVGQGQDKEPTKQ
jgi:hypothetical protein